MGKRVVKDPQERRQEFIDKTMELFIENGYSETSISQIVKAVNVARGTFYYYFESKKQILFEIIHRNFIDELIKQARPIVDNNELCALDKLRLISEMETKVSIEKLPNIQRIKNSDLFRRIFKETVKFYVPLLTTVIEQGNKEGVFDVPYPKEFCSIFHVSTMFFFHPGIFVWSEEEFETHAKGMICMMERGYGAEKGSLDFYKELFKVLHSNLHDKDGENI